MSTGRSHAKLWAAGAAVVSAIAGVASAIAAFSNGSPPPTPSAVPPASSVTVAGQPPAGGTAPSAAPSAAGSAAGSVRWTGKVVLGLEGIDLNSIPPHSGTSGFGIRPAAGRSGETSMEVKGTVALWTNAEAPTAQGCRDLLATQSRSAVTVAEGDSVCLVNEKSPIGVLKVTGTRYDEGSYGLIEGELTTWNLRPSR
ncbi:MULTISPECIES: hypothetical protein [unclassified Streptomyces]|uniref:hypothetical protein n=1 Tax=unclassified Streptomyces TaxID=2593676 RepID=UPI002E3155E0|nr:MULTISPECIES: hypothetical protein [unclassified Streptomyces]WUC64895.1 hypothetical protein OG861_11960 [Streptomyces sp. NBC_00539]